MQQQPVAPWGEVIATTNQSLFAGYVLAALPLLILFALTSRWFIQGFASGAVKL